MRFQIGTASGSERGLINWPMSEVPLAIARGTDSGAYFHWSKVFTISQKTFYK